MTTWFCKHCQWTGTEPSLSDASELRSDGTIDRVHIAVCPECFHVVRPTLEPKPRLYEYDCYCQRCGRRDGRRHVVAADAPKDGFFQTLCFHCSAGDEPRAA